MWGIESEQLGLVSTQVNGWLSWKEYPKDLFLDPAYSTYSLMIYDCMFALKHTDPM